MHDWYTFGTFLEEPTRSMIVTCFRTHLDCISSCCGIGAWLMHLLGTNGDTCLVHLFMYGC
jgi:hypothetical protein